MLHTILRFPEMRSTNVFLAYGISILSTEDSNVKNAYVANNMLYYFVLLTNK